jgi:hypothetical protein
VEQSKIFQSNSSFIICHPTDYTLIVPTESAFKNAGLSIPTWWSESTKGQFSADQINTVEKFLERYLIRGRLYMRDVKTDLQVQALDGSTYTFERTGKHDLICFNLFDLKMMLFGHNLMALY